VSLLRTALIGCVTAAVLLSAPAARAHVISDRELRVVAQMPPEFVSKTFAAFLPLGAGFVPPNRPLDWQSVAAQCPAGLLLIDAAARGDTALAERAWTALDVAIAQQLPDGNFKRAGAPTDRRRTGGELFGSVVGPSVDELADDAAWLASTHRALIAVMNSRLAERFRARYAAIKPRLQLTADFLEVRRASFLVARANDAPTLLTAAAAFLLADGTFHEPRYASAGEKALAAALELQEPDGSFPVAGRADPASHARALLALHSIAIYFPSAPTEKAAVWAAAWLKAHRRVATRDPHHRLAAAEIEFALRYAAIKPPAPITPATNVQH